MPMSRKIRVLITSMGSTAAQNLAHALAAEGDFLILGGDGRAAHGGVDLCAAHFPLPMGRDPAYLPALLQICEREGVDILIPVMEPELMAVAKGHDAFTQRGILPLVSPMGALETCFSKRSLSQAFQAVDLATPQIFDGDGYITYPAFSRPDFGTGSRGAMKLESPEDLAYARRVNPQLTLSAYIDGPEFSIDAFARQGGILCHHICRSRSEMKGGLAVRSTVVDMPQVSAEVARISEHLGLFGFFNLQFRLDAQGQARYFDLNARLGGAMALSFAAGLHPAPYLRALLGAPWPEQAKNAVGMQLFRRWHNVILPPGE